MELRLPEADAHLNVGSGTHAVQTARVMEALEPVLLKQNPDWLVVYGDVNSTVAAALVASKLHIPIAHVEAGLRSGDRSMPEEINRIITDQLSDLLFTPSPEANDHLEREGISSTKIHMVGNIMIDSLAGLLPIIENMDLRHESPWWNLLVHDYWGTPIDSVCTSQSMFAHYTKSC